MNRTNSQFGRPSKQVLLLLAPFFLLFLLFWVVPLIGGIQISLYSNEIYGESKFVGLENYRSLLNDSRYFKALKNTAIYTACSIVIIVPLSLVLAQLLQSVFVRLKPVITFFFLLPGLTPPAVLALLFLLVFHGRDGLLNRLFVMPLGLDPVNWLRDPKFVMPALVIQSVWRWTGFMTFFILAAMEAIPTTLYEAAHLETRSRWGIWRRVTLPMLRHVVLFVGIYLVVDAFSLFSGSYVLLGGSGGADNAGLLLVNYTYQQAFTFGKFGTGAAISLSIAPIMLIVLWLCFLRTSRAVAT